MFTTGARGSGFNPKSIKDNKMENDAEIKPGKPFYKTWNFWKQVVPVFVGAIAGYLYYHFVGCSSNQCAITSSPVMSTVWGGFMGYFLMNSPCARGRC